MAHWLIDGTGVGADLLKVLNPGRDGSLVGLPCTANFDHLHEIIQAVWFDVSLHNTRIHEGDSVAMMLPTPNMWYDKLLL